MALSKITAEFACEIEKLWNLVTSLENYSWRSDVRSIVITEPGKKFEEYTKEGYVTKFTITSFEPQERYAFDMENENMSGHWMGLFSRQGNLVRIEFTEDVTAKKWMMRPFVKGYLKRQQLQYIADLRKAVAEMA